MNTPTLQIKQELDRELGKIRANRDLSEEAKRRMITELYEAAEKRYREAIAEQERTLSERVGRLEKDVMGVRYPMAASEATKEMIRMSYRDAYDKAHYAGHLEDPQVAEEELMALLERADSSDDPQLADAVYHVATRKGLRNVADTYLEKRPTEKQRWEKYVVARQEADNVERQIGHAAMFGLMKPPELDGHGTLPAQGAQVGGGDER